MISQPALSPDVPDDDSRDGHAPGRAVDGFRRAPRLGRRWGLLVEDEAKTAGAALVQDAFRGLLATLFYLISSVTHDVVVYGRENIGAHHPTILISNHKRDLDSLVLQGIVYFGRGVSHPNRRLAFALREDAFWPGFLGAYLGRWRWLLSRLDVSPHMHLLKAFPMGHLNSRRELPRVREQLSRFAWLLDHGRDLYWTPEGGLTLDGHFGRFRAGLFRVVQQSHADLHLLPIAVFYDFMTTLRTRCFVRIGPELCIDRSLNRTAFERLARQAILSQMTVNVGHLAGLVLRDLPPGARLSRPELDARVKQHARRCREAGLALDPRLTAQGSFRRRMGQFLAYAERQNILRRERDGWIEALGEQHHEMVYALNEISEVQALLEA